MACPKLHFGNLAGVLFVGARSTPFGIVSILSAAFVKRRVTAQRPAQLIHTASTAVDLGTSQTLGQTKREDQAAPPGQNPLSERLQTLNLKAYWTPFKKAFQDKHQNLLDEKANRIARNRHYTDIQNGLFKP